MRRLAMVVLAAALLATPAFAQNLSLRAPDWAARLLASDILPTTGGRASISEPGIDFAVRVTLQPNDGGVARVIRYEARGEQTTLALRRFTGHPAAGWWQWGPDMPTMIATPPTARAQIEALARTAATASTLAMTMPDTACATGSRAFVEFYVGGRATTATRACLQNDALAQLVTRLSDLAGSRDEAELAAAANAELLEADRAFSRAIAANRAEGLRTFAAQGAEHVGPAALRTPRSAQVSSRGDMGWTRGALAIAAANGAPARTGAYVTVWTRDLDGDWKFASDVEALN